MERTKRAKKKKQGIEGIEENTKGEELEGTRSIFYSHFYYRRFSSKYEPSSGGNHLQTCFPGYEKRNEGGLNTQPDKRSG